MNINKDTRKMAPVWSKAKLWSAVRNKCLDCSGGYRDEVKLCTVKDCPLYVYRFGKAAK